MKAFSTKNSLDRTRWYMGGYWVFLAMSTETGGRFSLIEVNLRKGLEPPRHTHTNEDESFYLLEGEIRFFAGDEEHHLKTHEFVHIPRGTAHHFKLDSDTAKILIHLTPGGLEEMFIELSTPAAVIAYPAKPQGPPPPEWLKKAQALQQQFGIIGMDNSHIKAS